MANYPNITDSKAEATIILDYIYQALIGSGSAVVKTIGITDKVTTSPTNSTSPAYSIGDNIGGAITAALLRSAGTTGVLEDLLIYDGGNNKPALTIMLFSGAPAGTYTDNSPMVIAGDQAKMLGKINIETTDWETIGSVAVAHLKSINICVKAETALATDIYYAIMTRTAFTGTGGGSSEFTLRWGMLQD